MDPSNNYNLEESFVSTNEMAPSSPFKSSSSPLGCSPSKTSPSQHGLTQKFSFSHSHVIETPALVGYTGKKFKNPVPQERSPEKCPGLGYTGWYLGKSEGILGRVNKKTTSISTYEPNSDGTRSSQMEGSLQRERPVFEYDSNRVLNYENCVKEADSRGQSALKILSDIN